MSSDAVDRASVHVGADRRVGPWHGAAPDQDALQLTIYEGDVKWLDPVSDKEYLTAPRK